MHRVRSITTHIAEKIGMYSGRMNTGVFLFGFFLDIFTLPRIDHPFVPYLVGAHMAIIGGSILLDRILFLRQADRFVSIQKIFPFLASFSFGAILSFLLVYYARSSALGASWPFLLLIGAVMFGSEFFKKRLEGLRFYVILYAFLSILLAILFVPIILGQITTLTFLFSVIVGLLFVCAYLGVLFLVTREETRVILPRTILSVSIGSVLLIVSYFSGVMPAIPLVLKEGDVYTRVSRTVEGEYLREGTHPKWYTGVFTPRVYDWAPGTPVYFYTAVFAPTNLSGTIVHDWQYKDTQGEWVSVTRVSFPMRGGRADGYRGYSFKESITEGTWRVIVTLSDGRVVGRVPFVVREARK